MRNWPRPPISLSDHLRLKASMAILKALVGREKILWWDLPQDLVAGRDFWLNHIKGNLTARPTGMEVDVLAVAFCDLFFLEEFKQVEDGLQKLRRLSADLLSRGKPYQLNEWFQEAKARSVGHGSINLGFFNLAKLKLGTKNPLVDIGFLQLKHFAPSMIALTWIVSPSTEFTKRFQAIIEKDAYPEAMLKLTRHALYVASVTNPVFARQKEIDSLFLDLNQEIVRIMRKHIGAGMSMRGPLPSIEVMLTSEPLDFFPTDSDEVGRDQRLKDGFWSGLGFKRFRSTVYSGDDFRTYPILRRQKFHSISYQSLLSLSDFSRTRKTDGDMRQELRHHHSYFLQELCPVLALVQFFRTLQEELLEIRTYLAPSLRKQSQGSVHIHSLKSGVSKLATINGLHFEQLRATAELTDKFVKNDLAGDLKGINRKEKGGEVSGDLQSDLFCRVDQYREFNSTQIEVLRNSFQTLLDYRIVRTNHRVSVLLVILTVLLLLFTAVLFIPEADRASILKSALRLLRW